MKEGYFNTSDGARLYYRVSGEGEPIVLLQGFSMNSETQWAPENYAALEEHFTVYTFDYRAHGKSDVPESGMHIYRFAKDLAEFIDQMGLDTFDVMAHSMGNTIVWAYVNLFGSSRIKKFVWCDETPCLMVDPEWSEDEALAYCGTFRVGFWEKLFMENFEGKQLEAMLKILRNHFAHDWRDEIKRMTVPTLALFGGKSHTATKQLWNWVEKNTQNCRLEIFPAEEGGSHDMMRQNPKLFNQYVLGFLLGE